MQKLPSSMPRYVKSASFLQFHVVLVCFWTIGPIWTICGICGFLRSFAAKSPKVQKLLNVGRARGYILKSSMIITFYGSSRGRPGPRSAPAVTEGLLRDPGKGWCHAWFVWNDKTNKQIPLSKKHVKFEKCYFGYSQIFVQTHMLQQNSFTGCFCHWSIVEGYMMMMMMMMMTMTTTTTTRRRRRDPDHKKII